MRSGNYRLIFEVGDESLVTFDEALVSEDSAEEGANHRPYLHGDRISHLDMAVGAVPLVPPLPFTQPIKSLKRTDFTGDGNPDVLARNTVGVLGTYRGNRHWLLPRVPIGTGWNVMRPILS